MSPKFEQKVRKLEREVDALLSKQKKMKVAEVERAGTKLILPEGWSSADGINMLERKLREEETVVAVSEEFDAFPWDGAWAFEKALDEKFGYFQMVKTPGFFSDEPPAKITIPISATETRQVIWGRVAIQQLGGWLATSAQRGANGRYHFVLEGEVKRRFEGVVKEIGELVRKYLREGSIYRSKAIRIRFTDDNDEALRMPEPRFLDLSRVKPEELVFGKDVDDAIRTSLFTPILRTAEVKAHGIPLKRGVLLAGPFGVGKTLAAYVTAYHAEQNGWTFVYVDKAKDLAEAIRFALAYQPAVVFCEDVDRSASGRRDAHMDHLLNIVDGIEAKDTELMTVLTTNKVEEIEQALLRPGRLDAVVSIKPPDADAVRRLIRLYGRGLVPDEDPLDVAGESLKGQIAAVVRECVERAKLDALRLSDPGQPLRLTDEAVTAAARTMQMHLDLLAPPEEDKRSDIEKAADKVAGALRSRESVRA